jgi:hypothetical protein
VIWFTPRASDDGVVYLSNRHCWEIADLDITNDAPKGGDRRGIMISAANFGTVHHIPLKNLHMHHILHRLRPLDQEPRRPPFLGQRRQSFIPQADIRQIENYRPPGPSARSSTHWRREATMQEP